MKNQRVLLVGVSSGLGLMVAERMAEHDVTLYAAAPDVGPMKALESRGVHLLEMDVTNDDSVQGGVDSMLREQGGIDCVFSNAGLHVAGAIEVVPQEAVDRLYQVNVMGAARVIRAVTPTMREQGHGRMIFTSSVVSHVSMPMAGWYASSKHALLGMLTAYRYEVRGLGIEVVQIEPGQIDTGFDQASIARLRALEHPSDYQPFVDGYAGGMTKRLGSAPGATSTVQAIEKAILADEVKPVYRTTRDARLLPGLMQALPRGIRDSIVARAFRR